MTGPPLRVRGNEALLDEALFGEILLDETLFDKTLFDEVLFDEALFDNLLSDKWLLEERLCDGTPMSKRHPINKLINPLERFKCLFCQEIYQIEVRQIAPPSAKLLTCSGYKNSHQLTSF